LIASTVPNSMRACRFASAGDKPGARQVLGAGVDVEADLIAHLALETIATEEHAGERTKTGPHDLHLVRRRASAAPMADASLFHSAVSSLRRRRPAAVSV
jgi:hypothetical protein